MVVQPKEELGWDVNKIEALFFSRSIWIAQGCELRGTERLGWERTWGMMGQLLSVAGELLACVFLGSFPVRAKHHMVCLLLSKYIHRYSRGIWSSPSVWCAGLPSWLRMQGLDWPQWWDHPVWQHPFRCADCLPMHHDGRVDHCAVQCEWAGGWEGWGVGYSGTLVLFWFLWNRKSWGCLYSTWKLSRA